MGQHTALLIALGILALSTCAIGDGDPASGRVDTADAAGPPAADMPVDFPDAVATGQTAEGYDSGAALLRLMSVPAHATLRFHSFDATSGRAAPLGTVQPVTATHVGGIAGEIVYSNTPPPVEAVQVPAGILVADDISTVAVGGCNVSGYEFLVSGGGDGTGPGFTASFAVYAGCPGQGGQIVPGTSGSLPLPDDGMHSIIVDFSDAPVGLNRDFWIGVSFDRSGPGWVTGTPADIGFTKNRYHLIFTPCNARFGGTSLYAGFHARVYCTGDFEREFLAYSNPELDGPPFVPTDFGSGLWLADDVRLIVDDCVVSSLEIGSVGNSGAYTITAELWESCNQATLIPGSHAVAQGFGDGSPELVRFDFPDGLPLPPNTDSIWVAWHYNDDTAAILAGPPLLGESADLFGLYPLGCGLSFGGEPEASFAIKISCRGDPPIGACCTRVFGESCRESTPLGCLGSRAEWLRGAACHPEPFEPACGAFACCLPDPWPRGSCENRMPDECEALGGITDSAQFCGAGSQDCGWFACRGAQGDCCLSHGGIGCQSSPCCNLVCEIDLWCCEVAWDLVCAAEARDLCERSCTAGEVVWLDPPSGVVDARQPHAIQNAGAPLGIDSVRVSAPPHDSACCWELCESRVTTTLNGIAQVQDHGDDTYTIVLNRPITPGAVTTLTYRSNNGQTVETGVFISHPGNVSGYDETTPADILFLIDHLNGIIPPGWGLYSCDIDHSGECGPPDILRLIDLLNGAGAFRSWLGAPLPTAAGLCP